MFLHSCLALINKLNHLKWCYFLDQNFICDKMAEQQDTNAVRTGNDARFQSNIRAAQVQHNPLLNIRDRLFYALFCRVGLVYARSVPRQLQRTLEFLLLFEVFDKG